MNGAVVSLPFSIADRFGQSAEKLWRFIGDRWLDAGRNAPIRFHVLTGRCNWTQVLTQLLRSADRLNYESDQATGFRWKESSGFLAAFSAGESADRGRCSAAVRPVCCGMVGEGLSLTSRGVFLGALSICYRSRRKLPRRWQLIRRWRWRWRRRRRRRRHRHFPAYFVPRRYSTLQRKLWHARRLPLDR